jgi:hypothetical protein
MYAPARAMSALLGLGDFVLMLSMPFWLSDGAADFGLVCFNLSFLRQAQPH